MIAILCFLGYFAVFYFYRREQYVPALGIIILCGLCLRIWLSANPWLHPWDERYHALVAKNLGLDFLKPVLYEHPVLSYDYRNWTANHIWLHKQPLSLWLISVSIKLFGVNAFAVRVPSIIVSTIAIRLVYDLGKDLFNRKVALFSAFLFSIHGTIIELTAGATATDHIDICFLFFILLSIWLSIQGMNRKKTVWYVLAGITLGMAILSKWLPALMVLPIIFVIALGKDQLSVRKAYGIVMTIGLFAALTALPWQIYILRTFPLEARWEYLYNALHLTTVLEGHEGSFFYHFDNLRIKFGEAVYLPVAWFTCYTIKKRKANLIAVFLWFWVPFIFFSFTVTKMPAYTMIAAPAIFMMCAVFFFKIFEWLSAYPKYRWGFYLVAAALIILPLRYSVERVKPFNSRDEDRDRYQSVSSFGRRISNPSKTIVFNCPDYIELMFYSGCTAYPYIPEANTVDDLKERGFNVYFYAPPGSVRE